jgi:hypothetical protein
VAHDGERYDRQRTLSERARERDARGQRDV